VLRREMQRLGMPNKENLPHRAGTKEKPPVLRWAETGGFASIGFGGVGLMTVNFSLSVSLVYFGLITLLISLYFEHFGSYRWTKWILAGCVLVVGVYFSSVVTFRRAPIDVTANTISSKFPLGTVIGGIEWQPEFAYLRVSINNETDLDFENVDLVLEADVSIVAIGKISDSPEVTFHGDITKETVDIGGVFVRSPSIQLNFPDGHNVDVPARQLSAPRYRVQCQKIPKNTSVDLVLALAEVDEAHTPDSDHIAVLNPDGRTTQRRFVYGRGDKEATVAYVSKMPSSITISGTYTALFKPRTIEKRTETIYNNDLNKP
jgi:hypothetical protein